MHIGILELLDTCIAIQHLVLIVLHRIVHKEVFVEIARLVKDVMYSFTEAREENLRLLHLACLLQLRLQVLVKECEVRQLFEFRHQVIE